MNYFVLVLLFSTSLFASIGSIQPASASLNNSNAHLHKYYLRLSSGIGVFDQRFSANQQGYSYSGSGYSVRNSFSKERANGVNYNVGFEFGFRGGTLFRYSFAQYKLKTPSNDSKIRFQFFDLGYLRKTELTYDGNLRLVLGPSLLWVKSGVGDFGEVDKYYLGGFAGLGYESDIKSFTTFYTDIYCKYNQRKYNERWIQNFNFSVVIGMNINLGLLGEKLTQKK